MGFLNWKCLFILQSFLPLLSSVSNYFQVLPVLLKVSSILNSLIDIALIHISLENDVNAAQGTQETVSQPFQFLIFLLFRPVCIDLIHSLSAVWIDSAFPLIKTHLMVPCHPFDEGWKVQVTQGITFRGVSWTRFYELAIKLTLYPFFAHGSIPGSSRAWGIRKHSCTVFDRTNQLKNRFLNSIWLGFNF